MNKKTVKKLAITAIATSIIGAIAYKVVKDKKEKKYIMDAEDEYLEEEQEDMSHANMLKMRKYIKLGK